MNAEASGGRDLSFNLAPDLNDNGQDDGFGNGHRHFVRSALGAIC